MSPRRALSAACLALGLMAAVTGVVLLAVGTHRCYDIDFSTQSSEEKTLLQPFYDKPWKFYLRHCLRNHPESTLSPEQSKLDSFRCHRSQMMHSFLNIFCMLMICFTVAAMLVAFLCKNPDCVRPFPYITFLTITCLMQFLIKMVYIYFDFDTTYVDCMGMPEPDNAVCAFNHPDGVRVDPITDLFGALLILIWGSAVSIIGLTLVYIGASNMITNERICGQMWKHLFGRSK